MDDRTDYSCRWWFILNLKNLTSNSPMHSDNSNLLPKNGVLFYQRDFLDVETSTAMFENMLNEIPWQQRSITMFGKTINQPRLISWHAKPGIHYRYSGIDLTPTPWTNDLLDIKNSLESKINHTFNSAFLNLYRHGHDYMGWHRDNEKSLGPQPYIASISLGAERRFKLKHMHEQGLDYELLLHSGSLLIMAGDIQHFWKHCLPKALKVKLPRINITFRSVTA